MEGRANMKKKKDNQQLETIPFETISKVVKNCTTPKKSFITSDGVKIYGYDNADDFNKALKVWEEKQRLIPMTEEEEYRTAGITKEEINKNE